MFLSNIPDVLFSFNCVRKWWRRNVIQSFVPGGIKQKVYYIQSSPALKPPKKLKKNLPDAGFKAPDVLPWVYIQDLWCRLCPTVFWSLWWHGGLSAQLCRQYQFVQCWSMNNSCEKRFHLEIIETCSISFIVNRVQFTIQVKMKIQS